MISHIISIITLGADSVRCSPNDVDRSGVCNALFNFAFHGLPVGDLQSLIKVLLNDFGNLVGLIAIAVIVYAGFRMVTANGDKKVIDQAKAALKYAIYGFVTSVFAYTVVIALENFVGVQSVDPNDARKYQNPLDQFTSFRQFVVFILSQVLGVIGLVSILMIILHGFRYATSRGDKTQIDNAKQGLTWAIAGLALSLLAYTIIKALANLTSGTL
jgi:cytochrome bd-type quinol oxidase subunit 2